MGNDAQDGLTPKRNDFVAELLKLQQDGSGAISAPSNWAREPLLRVKTGIDDTVDAIVEAIRGGANGKGSQPATPKWFFFLGSPGNGKSAAMGALYRQLKGEGYSFTAGESGRDLSDVEDTEPLPYEIEIRAPGTGTTVATIIQDASVARNPLSGDIDPASDLAQAMGRAADRGRHLIVCSNRGVLEKALRDCRAVGGKELDAEMTTALESAMRGDPGKGGMREAPRAGMACVSVLYLDNRSLLIGKDTFADIIREATDGGRWEPCVDCALARMCPFKANRDWLANREALQNLIKTLRRAEALSGQVIVFREALALVSFILAGTRGDYGVETPHPCQWVERMNERGDAFSLIGRRVYMGLFASHAPWGLEPGLAPRGKPGRGKVFVGLLKAAKGIQTDTGRKAANALKGIMEGRPSTDVGIPRLLAPGGTMARLDPCRDFPPPGFYREWDASLDADSLRRSLEKHVGPGAAALLTDLEIECMSILNALSDRVGELQDQLSNEETWLLKRWGSNVMLHLGALAAGYSAWSKEIDEFIEMLGLFGKENPTAEDGVKKDDLGVEINDLFLRITGLSDGNFIKLSNSLYLSLDRLGEAIRMQPLNNDASGSVSLSISFAGQERCSFGAPLFIWMKRYARKGMGISSFPRHLLAGAIDARLRSVMNNMEIFDREHIILRVETADGNHMTIRRTAEGVTVQ